MAAEMQSLLGTVSLLMGIIATRFATDTTFLFEFMKWSLIAESLFFHGFVPINLGDETFQKKHENIL